MIVNRDEFEHPAVLTILVVIDSKIAQWLRSVLQRSGHAGGKPAVPQPEKANV